MTPDQFGLFEEDVQELPADTDESGTEASSE